MSREREDPYAKFAFLDDPEYDPDRLVGTEIFWRDHQVWLQDCGYMLRPRYRPGWVASWLGTEKDPYKCEDGIALNSAVIIDAIRIRDNVDVCLKSIDKDVHEFEVAIGSYFSSASVATDLRNHCVPILEILQVPDDTNITIIVMPLLREYGEPRFDTFGEIVDFFGQIFEGLKFMHDHNVAHRDCNGYNIMMDGYHAQRPKKKRDYCSGRAKFYTRTQKPPKYYLIDFGLSRMYETRHPPPLEDPILGGDKSVPEFRFSEDGDPPEACDPFPTDVYYLGNMIRVDFLEGNTRSKHRKAGLEFMKPLVNDMVSEDPAKRPTMDEVVERFKVLRKNLNFWKLRSRVVIPDNFPLPTRPLRHWYLRIWYILRRVPAIPKL
ncbi:kinase-like domain-containing protein [Mycena crocata]|nr:kinase-like domain-containing protein [Mycena crocata]